MATLVGIITEHPEPYTSPKNGVTYASMVVEGLSINVPLDVVGSLPPLGQMVRVEIKGRLINGRPTFRATGPVEVVKAAK